MTELSDEVIRDLFGRKCQLCGNPVYFCCQICNYRLCTACAALPEHAARDITAKAEKHAFAQRQEKALRRMFTDDK